MKMKFSWHKSYEKNMPFEVDPREFRTLIDELEEGFRRYETLPAFHNMGTTLTYGEVDQLSKRFAGFLQQNLRLKKGDRVAIMLPNILQFPIVFYGVLRAGLIAVNINPLYTSRELEYQLKDSGAETIIVFSNAASVLQKTLPNSPIKNVIITSVGDLLQFPKNYAVNFIVKNVKKLVPEYSISDHIEFKKCLSPKYATNYIKPHIELIDTALFQYTGGTTGLAKGAVLTHGNIGSNILQAKAWIKNLIKDGEEIIVTPLPLYHMFSLTANLLLFHSVGALNILITNPKDIPHFVKELSRWKFTALTGVNTLFNALLNNSDFKNIDFKNLKITLGGGMAVQKNVAESWKEVTGKPLIEAFGMTETSPAVCINPVNMTEFNGYIGLPLPSTEIAIMDDDCNRLGPDEIGEICVRGPQVMKGYWNKPEETKKVLTEDGFFKTGDLGYITTEGFVKIVDRKKDMIIVSGFNVYPNELEDIISRHSKVLEVAVVGHPDEKSGECVKVFIVKKDRSLMKDEVIAFCRENLAPYKVPKIVEFQEELPKSILGKILRKELKNYDS